MRWFWSILLLVVGMALIALILHHRLGWSHGGSGALAHARSEFTFTVHAPGAMVFPLFGPEGERPWAGRHWDPKFMYPVPARDVEGAVFRVMHGHHSAVWVNTAFNAQAGHAAYVYVIDGKLATRIDVQLAAVDEGTTKVRVMYERTALRATVNEDVEEMAQTDPKMGADWEQSIAEYLKKRGSGGR